MKPGTGLIMAPEFEISTDAVTQTFGIVGKRGVGKTATAGVLAEEMLERLLQDRKSVV